MGIIKAVNLIFDYIKRDEEEQVEGVDRALDGLTLDIEEGSFVCRSGSQRFRKVHIREAGERNPGPHRRNGAHLRHGHQG